jgi:hypothetical protein
LFYLRRYAPERNPDDNVNNDVKQGRAWQKKCNHS